MSQEQRQQAAREEKLVPSADRVKITATNMRIEPTVPQKEETFQVVLVIIKASPCFKDFTITTDKFSVDVKVFREILDIFPRVPNEDFVAPSSEEVLFAFLIELGNKGPLDHLARMFVDHMHQPCRTLAIIINKSLSGKTSNNDRLHQSRVSILWGMFYKKKLTFPKLIWKTLHTTLNTELRKPEEDVKSCPTLDLRKSSSITSSYLTLPFPKDQALQSEAYQTFIKYSTGLIPLKKRRGKGTQGKKSAVILNPTRVEVFDESDLELARRQTGNRRKSKKKFLILADENIILELYVTLELGKSISLTEAEEEEAAMQVHATHERLVTESDPKPARRSTSRRPSDIAFRDTSSVSKKKSPDQSQKLKGIQTMTAEE
ncbi:hypothetical protein Tco_0257574 [Tanacetum coccineum]